MVRLIAILLLASSCFAGVVANLAANIIGNNKPVLQQLFSNDSDYIDNNGNPDISAIATTLKLNSLLNLSYNKDVKFDVKFKTEQSSPLLLIKIVKDAMSKLGYNEILTTGFLNDGNVTFDISVSNRFVLDPGAFYSALKSSNTIIKNIKKTGDFSYFYELDISNSSVQNIQVNFGENDLNKPLSAYLVEVGNAKTITIQAKSEDHWECIVRLLDKRLNLIEEKHSNGPIQNIEIQIPDLTKYIMIDDKNSLENIRHGLKIYLK